VNPTNRQSLITALVLVLVAGCANEEKEDRDFHTSGSREADQRAEQRIVKEAQLRGEGEGADARQDQGKKPLYDRLGGDKGVGIIVDDFINRALADPRVNWERKGITRGGVLGIGDKSAEWNADPTSVARLKKHIVQFLTLATGGPAVKYEGRTMRESHKGLKITNAEFDATVGDLKATLDSLRVATDEQKELIAVVESTRPQIVEER
jgi:hemoglobin